MATADDGPIINSRDRASNSYGNRSSSVRCEAFAEGRVARRETLQPEWLAGWLSLAGSMLGQTAMKQSNKFRC